MTQKQETETSLQSDFQNIDEYSKFCINFFSSIINENNLSSEEISDIIKIISSLLELGSVQDSISEKITNILTSSTSIVSYAFQKNYSQLLPSLESIFNPRKSFYTHNSKEKNPSYTWAIVVDNFVQSTSLESILNCLKDQNNEEFACSHFFYFAKILKNISIRIESTKYQTILKQTINYLMNFLTKTKKYAQYIQLYKEYFQLSSKVLLNPDDFSDFLLLLNHACQEPKLIYFGCQQLIVLLKTPAKSLIITQSYCDFILSLNYSDQNIKRLLPLYILFVQNNLIDFSKLEMLCNKRKSLIINCIAEYIDPKQLKLFIQKNKLDDVNLSIFIQFINHSDEEPLLKSTIQKVLLFGDNETNQNNVYNQILLLFSNNKILPTIFEETSLLLPSSQTTLCSDLIEKIRSKILEDGNYFISHLRNVKTISQLQQLIETVSRENKNQSVYDEFEKCHVFEILINDITNMRFGSEGICTILSLFKSFSSYILPMLNKLIPNLLNIFSIEGDDKLFTETVSLLNELYDLSPDESLIIIEANIRELSQAIGNIPDSNFDCLKEFVLNLDDKLFFALLAFSINNDQHFYLIYSELETEIKKKSNSIEYIKKCLLILNQLDEDNYFEQLFNEFLSKLSQKVVDQNEFIVNDLLNIAQNIHSVKIMSLIFNSFEYISSLSNSASKKIDDFMTNLSSVKLNEYNISPLEIEQSRLGQNILLSDRSDVDSVLQVLYHSFPFNFLAVTSTETNRYSNSMSKIQFLFQEMNLCKRKFICINDLANYFAKLQKEPADFFINLTKNCPEKWRDEFQFKLETETEGKNSEIHDLCCLTVPIFGSQSLNEAIFDLFNKKDEVKKSMKFVTIPPVLAIQLTQNTNGVEVPINLNINDDNKYNLTASVVLDPATNEFNALVKKKENWTLYTSKDTVLLSKIDGILKSSHLVFYTQNGSSVDEIINDNLTALYVEHPFNLIGYINKSSLEKIEEKNEDFRLKFSVLNETTIKFMIDHSEHQTLLRYLVHVICHSTDKKFVEIATEKLIKNLSGDQIVNYIESDFDFFIDSLSHSPYSEQLIRIIDHSMSTCSSDDSLIQLIQIFLRRLSKIQYDELNPISQIVFNYVSLSDSNAQIARQNEWHQQLTQVMFSVFNFNRKYDFLRNLDLSPLFKTLSILVTPEFLPGGVYSLFNISEQVLISEKHDEPFLAFLFKLNSFNIFQNKLDANKIISYINSFQTIIGRSEVPEIPPFFDASCIFSEIQSQVELGNETLRSNMLKVFLPKLITYLENKNKSVRNAAQSLIYVLCGYPSKSIYDHVIRELLSRLQNATDCSTILEVCYNLVNKSKLFDDDYLQPALICKPCLRSSKDINELLLSYCQLFDRDKVSPNLGNLIESIDGNYDELTNYVEEFDRDSIEETLELQKWNQIMDSIDIDKKVAIFEKVLPSGNKADSFIANSIINDKSLTLSNSFLDKSIGRFKPSEIVDLFNLLDLEIKKSNNTQNDENQFYLDSIVNFADAVLPPSVVFPPKIELDSNELVKFFNNFWPGIPSEKLLLILNKISGKNPDFLRKLRDVLLNQIETKIEPNEPEKWQFAIVCSDLSLKNRNELSLSKDEDFANEMKRIHDLACTQNENVPNSNPRSLFKYYTEKLAEDPNAEWIPILASKLYPESKLSSDEEKEFYRLALAENREKLASEKAEQIAKEKAEAERIEREKAEAAKIAREKARAERIAKEKAEAERIAKEKAEAERLAREKEEAERLAREKEEAERLAREKEEAEKLEKEKVEAERNALKKAENERIALKKAEAEKLAKEIIESDKLGLKKNEVEKLLKEKSQLDKPEKEQLQSDKLNDTSYTSGSNSVNSQPIEIVEEEEEADDFLNEPNDLFLPDKFKDGQIKSNNNNNNNEDNESVNDANSIKNRSIEVIKPGDADDAINNQSHKNEADPSLLDKSKEGQIEDANLNNEDQEFVDDANSIKDRSIEMNEKEEETDTKNDQSHKNNSESVKSPIRGLSNGSSQLNLEQRQLNSLLFGEEEDKIDQKDGMGDFSLDEFSNELQELDQSSDTATAAATAVGTAALTTVSYLLYKYMRKPK